jgi:DNA-binding protein HU-beta
MTKAEIVNIIAEQTGIGKKEVTTTVEAFMEQIRISLADNKENVYLRGFGSFIVKHRAQKTARNISKNTTMVIDAHDLPAFKPCKSFIERMDGKEVITGDDNMED